MSVTPTKFKDLLKKGLNSGDKAALDELLTADSAARVHGTTLYLREIQDHLTDADSRGDDFLLNACRSLASQSHGRTDGTTPSVTGLLDLVQLTVLLLKRRFESLDRDADRRLDNDCRALFAGDTPPIQQAIRAIYQPKGKAGKVPLDAWNCIDFDQLAYHKAGTTSFILSAPPVPKSHLASTSRLAIKCVLFPWNKIAAIAQATSDYTTDYGAQETTDVVVRPLASTDRWILMPFQDGETLGDYLEPFTNGSSNIYDRLTEARRVARFLCRALHTLANGAPVVASVPARQHLDLSPNNVILAPHTKQVWFIDLGRNHLYSRQVGILEHDDSVYVAPEVKNRSHDTTLADVYSIGIILTEIVCGHPPREGGVPLTVWTTSPTLGRVLEDLIEHKPERRLLLFSGARSLSFEELGKYLDTAFKLALDEAIARPTKFKRLYAAIAPTSREVATQRRQWNTARRDKLVQPRYAAYLLFFAMVSSACWWFIVAKTALAKLDDLVVGDFKPLPDGDELAAHVIALSQALVAAKFYQTILGRVTTRGLPGFLPRVTEIAMRAMTVVAMPTTALAVYWKPSLWPWTCAAGALAVAVTNLLMLVLAQRVLRSAEKEFSGAPAVPRLTANGFDQWWWTMLLYAIVIAVIAFGLQLGWLHDTAAYVFGLVLISAGIHYLAKCVRAGFAIRGELAHAFFLGERMSLLRDH